jgi:hypothetical protein
VSLPNPSRECFEEELLSKATKELKIPRNLMTREEM